jgi:transposase
VVLAAGQVHDSHLMAPVLNGVRVPRVGRGRPRTRVGRVLADKGYSYRRCRALLRRKGQPVLIPERSDQRAQRRKKGRRGGRPFFFDGTLYKDRNIVERSFLRLKQFRRVATRYEKLGQSYRTFVTLASIRLWLK